MAGCNGGGGRTRPRSTFHHVSRLSFAAFVYLSRPRWRVSYSVLIFQRATRLRSPRLQGWLFLTFPRPLSLSCLFSGCGLLAPRLRFSLRYYLRLSPAFIVCNPAEGSFR